MFRKIYFDTSPIIYLLQKHDLFFPQISTFLNSNEQAVYVTSVVTVAEYDTFLNKHDRPDLQLAFDGFAERTYLQICSIDLPIAKRAAHIRATYPAFKLMDALQLATACIHNCDCVLTNDRQLKQFQDIKVLTMPDLQGVTQ